MPSGLTRRVDTGFRKRSCSNNRIERGDESKKNQRALAALVQIIVYGAVISAIYAMLAVGFTLIFGVARVLNLAHGSFYALGAYLVYSLTAEAHLPLWLAAILAVAFVALFGVLIERVLV